MNLRTEDINYGEDYWTSMDNGAGAVDSVMWEDIAFIVKDLFGFEGWHDIGGDIHHLDIGCGFGFLSKHLRRRGIDSHGCDFSEWALGHCDDYIAPYLRLHDMTEDVEIPNWSSVGFNLITAFEFMEHIPEEHVPDLISRIFQRLASGGHVLLAICLSDRPGWDSDPTHVTIKPWQWWQEHLSVHDWEPDPDRFDRLRSFHLFSEHNGVFLLRKP